MVVAYPLGRKSTMDGSMSISLLRSPLRPLRIWSQRAVWPDVTRRVDTHLLNHFVA